MKDKKLIIFLKKYPLFLFLLPLFFVFHGSVENYDFVPFWDASLLTMVYWGFSILFLLLCWLLYRNWLKAAVVAFSIMAFHFFFGSMQDTLRHYFPSSFLSKYIFILPFSLCLFILLIIFLKKRKKTLGQLAFYLSSLFVLLIVIDFVMLIGKMNATHTPSSTNSFVNCAQCPTPDVYVIIADEYAGNSELKEIFHFDDSSFLNQLAQRGFHIVDHSSSNYNYTPYSIASTLDMNYLDLDRQGKQPLLSYTYETIRNNSLLQFFENNHYAFYNYSFFDVRGQPALTQESFLPARTRLITGQTFLSRIQKELRFLLVTKFRSEKEIKKDVYFHRDNNEKFFQLTVDIARRKTGQPRFVLTHLMMPHYPYYYDRNGNEFPFETLKEGNQSNQLHYIEYLQYSNKRLLQLVDQVLENSPAPPIIVLIGDHGFRHFTNPVDPKYYFYNLVSVHLPGNDYSAFGDSLSNVNLFRTVLNTSFGQRLPYHKDSTIIMENP